MANKSSSKQSLNEDKAESTKPGINKIKKKSTKKSSSFVPASVGRSAVEAVKANSSKNIRGSSGLANTGTIISYD